MVDVDDFEDGSILQKNLNPTPPDIWDIAIKLDNVTDLGELSPHTYFSQSDRITLDMSNEYFNKLVQFMVDNYNEDIFDIIQGYQNVTFSSNHASMLDLLTKLKSVKKCPAIILQENSTSCMRLVRNFAKDIVNAEKEKYPDLIAEREKHNKKAKKLEKKNEKNKIDDMGEKKRLKLMMQEGEENKNVKAPSIEEP